MSNICCTAAYVVVYLRFPFHHLSPLGTKLLSVDAFRGAKNLIWGWRSIPSCRRGLKTRTPNRKECIMDSGTMNAMAMYLMAKT